MQIVFFSEDFPKGRTSDWPTVPRVGDIMEFSNAGGIDRQKVDDVVWHAEADGSFHSISVHLTY